LTITAACNKVPTLVDRLPMILAFNWLVDLLLDLAQYHRSMTSSAWSPAYWSPLTSPAGAT